MNQELEGLTFNNENIQIDAVIPWVDGNDEVWQKKLNNHSKIKIDFSQKKDSTRFKSIGEINFAIRSIIKFAPFFRTIYIVTDGQTPDSFESLKIKAKNAGIDLKTLDHKMIFKGYENHLPCFNSTSIISLFHKIPDLSEYYVIFNDDTFIMRNVEINDFFINGNPVLRGVWEHYYENLYIRKIYYRYFASKKEKERLNSGTIRKAMQYGAKLADDGGLKFLKRLHNPISIRKSSLVDFFEKNETLLKKNVSYKFRNNNEQFITETLANHLEIKKRTFKYKKNTQLTYFRSYKNHLMVKWKLFWFEINEDKLFMTFQSLDMADHKTQDYILKWLEERLK